MRRTFGLFLLPLLAIAAFLAACRFGSDAVAGGSSSEGEAKITGIARYEDGRVAAGARVRLRPAGWIDTGEVPGAGDGPGAEVRADALGRFVLSRLAPGEYSLEVTDEAGQAALARPLVERGSAEVAIAPVLLPTGAVRGSLIPAPGPGKAYVQVLGLDRFAPADSLSGDFVLPAMPAGVYTLVSRPAEPAYQALSVPGVEVKPRDTVDVGAVDRPEDLVTWAHRRRLEAIPAGLGPLASPLARVPVLIALDSTFPFAEAGARGEDIRFSGGDGSQLRFGFKGWDPARGRAEIWVRVDSLRAGADTQGIWIHWGKPGAVTRSKGYGLFHTNQGFHGVWHLAAGQGPNAYAVQDSSSNRNHGRAASASPWADSGAASPFGALRLDSANPSVATTKVYAANAFTVSFWFRTETRAGGRMGGFGDARTGNSLLHDRVIWMDTSGRIAFGLRPGLDTAVAAAPSVLVSPSAYNDGRWHQVAVRLSAESGQALYVDGALAASDPAVKSTGDFAGWWRIGQDDMAGWEPAPASPAWTGLLQEFWVIHRAMDAEWIRFHHATSRPRLP